MKKVEIHERYLIILLLFSFLSVPMPAPAQTDRGMQLKETRTALIIGNGSYQTAPLKNPVNDAEDMAAALKGLGFAVTLRRDADQRTMEDAIRSFGRQLSDGGVGLFYFAGHGMQVQGRNYLIPVDARIESESDVKYEAVDAGRVLGKMEDAGNQLNIVILDACRNNPFSKDFRTYERGLARMDAPTGSLIAYATAPGEVAADGTDRNGIFTRYLMKHMLEPGLPIERVLKRVRIDVARNTNGRQIPWESSSLMGEFYFNPAKSSAAEQNSVGISAPDSQKQTLAAIPKVKEEMRPPNRRHTLAIFPWKLDIFYVYSKDTLYDIFFDAVQNSVESFPDMRLGYSFYVHDEFDDHVEILTDAFSEERSFIWTKASVLTTPRPDLEKVYEIAAKINTDLVLLFQAKVTDNTGKSFNSLYIVDTKRQKMFNRKYNAYIFNSDPFESILNKVFAEYLARHGAN